MRERHATAAERKLLTEAKGLEIQEFLKERAVEAISQHEMKNLKPSDIMKMRFVLTWKVDPTVPGGKRAKARLVVLGFQDPFLGKEKTLAPTMHKRTRTMMMQAAVQNQWKVLKGDVKAAFLQGKEFSDKEQRYALPPPELAKALGMDPKDPRPVKLLKAIYGLTRAPLDWYLKVAELCDALGGRVCKTDPCCWIFHDKKIKSHSDNQGRMKGQVIGIIGAHVDDFLLSGDQQNAQWQYILKQLHEAFRWSPWEEGDFKQTGLRIRQDPTTYEITLDQEEYLETLEEIEIDPGRKKQKDLPVTEAERTALRGSLGALQWLCTQTSLNLCAETGLNQSMVTRADIGTLEEVNKIVRKAKKTPHMAVQKIQRLPDDPVGIGWTDASLQNRPDFTSTGGYVIGLAGPEILKDESARTTVVSWRSHKLPRVGVSSLSVETQALRTMEDELYMVRLCWAELTGYEVDVHEADMYAQVVPATSIIDAKAIYDAITSRTSVHGMIEKRTAIELMAYIQDTSRNGTKTRWVHGGANLADGLTKAPTDKRLEEFITKGEWQIVDDPEAKSAKKRAKDGEGRLDSRKAIMQEERDFQGLTLAAIHEAFPQMIQDDAEDEEFFFPHECSANNNF